jgi:hypothetical protein
MDGELESMNDNPRDTQNHGTLLQISIHFCRGILYGAVIAAMFFLYKGLGF